MIGSVSPTAALNLRRCHPETSSGWQLVGLCSVEE